jgi:hypothetical protein
MHSDELLDFYMVACGVYAVHVSANVTTKCLVLLHADTAISAR